MNSNAPTEEATVPILLREEDELSVELTAQPPAYDLDVRPMLEAGGEPYQVIMHCVGQLGAGELLRIHALFEPRPLLRQLERMGMRTETAPLGPDHWVVSVTRLAGA